MTSRSKVVDLITPCDVISRHDQQETLHIVEPSDQSLVGYTHLLEAKWFDALWQQKLILAQCEYWVFRGLVFSSGKQKYAMVSECIAMRQTQSLRTSLMVCGMEQSSV